jgi:hypothetical protein
MRGAMYFLMLAIFSFPAFAGVECGSKKGFFNAIASIELIPDFFPPENRIFDKFLQKSSLNRCDKVSLSNGCRDHDLCYDMRLGKRNCDKKLLFDWVYSCKKASNDLICESACEIFVTIMSEAQRYDDGAFCPSCEAYNQ